MPRRNTYLNVGPLLLALLAHPGLRAEGEPVPRLRVGEVRTVTSGELDFNVELLTTDLNLPWSMTFIGSDQALLTERRPAAMLLMNLATGERTSLQNLPDAYTKEDAGMKDVLADPDFGHTHRIYFSYSAGDDAGSTLVVERARLSGTELVDRKRLFVAEPLATWEDHWYHYGARLLLHDGYLYISVGERHRQAQAQDLAAHGGSIVRLREDGSVPEDNPFVGKPGARAEIWSLGHRNPQGIAFDPRSGLLWEDEHGPQGGDEINIIRRGMNYGWPVITYGREYDGTPVGDGIQRRDGLEQPVFYFKPSIAPSDLLIYSGTAFPGWQGNLFLGSLSRRYLLRLVTDGERIIHQEILLADLKQRLRFVREAPDGSVYVGTDDGWLLHLTRPATN